VDAPRLRGLFTPAASYVTASFRDGDEAAADRPAAVREPAYALWRQLALVGRPATVEEVAAATLFLLDNGNMTGSTLYCDGGYSLR